MATISFSPALVAAITNQLTTVIATSPTLDTTSYLFQSTGPIPYVNGSSTGNGKNVATVYFKNSAGTTLATASLGSLTRTQDVNGYVAFTNFPSTTPSQAGTIDYIQISQASFTYNINSYTQGVVSSTPYTVTLTVGDTGSGADVEIANRDLVTNQPWRLDGAIRFRVPDSYTYSS